MVKKTVDKAEVSQKASAKKTTLPKQKIARKPKAEKAAKNTVDNKNQSKVRVKKNKQSPTKEVGVDAQPSSRRHRPMPAVFRVLFSVIFLYLMSFVTIWYIEWRQNSDNAGLTWQFIEEKPMVFWYNSLILFFLLLTVSAVLWRPFLATAIIFAVSAVLMYANEQKYIYRAAPLLPEDLHMAGNANNLLQFVDGWEVTRLALGIILMLTGAGILEYKARRYLGRMDEDLPFWEKHSIVPRATFFIMSFTALSLAAAPVIHRSRSSGKDKIDFLNVEIEAWNQTKNYEKNGFMVSFLYNMGASEMQPPGDYNRDRMRELALKYQKIKSQNEDDTKKTLDEVVDNVIIILDETFYDPSLLLDHYAYSGGDVTPNLHEIFKHYPSGYMYSPEYGGGTANVEFAVLTGFSNYWANITPYVNALSKHDLIPGVAGFAKNQDFSTTAIHSYDGTMYKRNIVYRLMGYDNFLDQSSMEHTERENGQGYISDSEVFREILNILQEDKDNKHMIGAITMQNHGPYESANYPELQFHLNEPKSNQHAVESVLQSIHYADQYVGEFLRELDRLDSRTVVLWFGDHAAGILDDYINSDIKRERDLAHLTPYFIYSNFEIASLYTEEEVARMNGQLGFDISTEGVDLPIVTPNCLTNEMYNILNIKKPPLMYLLDKVCAQTPILDNTYLDGRNPATYDELLEYELINYDILGGKQYWVDLTNDS